MSDNCCIPGPNDKNESGGASTSANSSTSTQVVDTRSMVLIPAGKYKIGYEGPHARPEDGEGPVREIDIGAYYIDVTSVTNEQFSEFIEATGYVTESEKFGWAYVFFGQLSKSKQRKSNENQRVQGLQWWSAVEGAFWKKPEGPGSNLKKRMDHPVVSVSWNDAAAYAQWAGKSLPTEAQWEIAARGGTANVQTLFPWGDELEPKGKHRCNVWQGDFPVNNTQADGYSWTAPAASYRRYEVGVYNMIGNVWEWCQDNFSATHHALEASSGCCSNPQGPHSGDRKVMKGGSFLCHDSYCNRYRLGARTANTPDSATTNIGFRCVYNAE